MAVITDETVREQVRTWLAENWDPDLTVAEWWERLMRSGYAAPTWPEDDFGRGYNRGLANVVNEELAKAGAIGPPAGLGYLLAGPTIVAHGTREQKDLWLPRILNGQDAWCQLFSEPGAGSDLAGLQCKAERDGDEWVITGQKVWTSTAQLCNLGMLIARTDPDAPKHAGITYFAFEMDQPGVEIRPLREMTGRAMFNEVFIDGARVPDGNMIGGLNNGWAVTNTTLAAERAGLGSGGSGAAGTAFPGPLWPGSWTSGSATSSARSAPAEPVAAGGNMAQSLIKLAKDTGRASDPNVRQSLARMYSLQQIGKFSSLRARAGRRERRRAEHGQAHDERHAAPEPRGRDADPRRRDDAHGPGRRARRGRAGDDPVLARSVDLRRHRPGAAQHPRRARARPAQGAGPEQGCALQGRSEEHLRSAPGDQRRTTR